MQVVWNHAVPRMVYGILKGLDPFFLELWCVQWRVAMDKPIQQTLHNTLRNTLQIVDPPKPEKRHAAESVGELGQCDPARFLLPFELEMIFTCQSVHCINEIKAADGIILESTWTSAAGEEQTYRAAFFCSYECVLVTLNPSTSRQ